MKKLHKSSFQFFLLIFGWGSIKSTFCFFNNSPNINQIKVISLLVIFVVLILAFALIIYRKTKKVNTPHYRKKNAFLKKLMIDHEKEQGDFSSTLSNQVGQLISTAKLYVSSIENQSAKKQIQYIDESLSLLDQAVNEIRTVSNKLRPPTVEKLGLVRALNDKFNPHVNIQSNQPNIQMPPHLEIIFFKLLTEWIQAFLQVSKNYPEKIIITFNHHGFKVLLVQQNVNFKQLQKSKLFQKCTTKFDILDINYNYIKTDLNFSAELVINLDVDLNHSNFTN